MSSTFNTPFPAFIGKFRGFVNTFPRDISQRAVLEIKNNFRKGGYESESGSFIPWKLRKMKDKGASRALLIKTGRLSRSPKAAPLPLMPRVVTDVPYAEPLNDGYQGSTSVRSFTRQATRVVKIKGSYSKLGNERGKGRKYKMLGAQHQVKGFTRKVDLPSRPFMTVGPSFLDKEEKTFFDTIETMFIQS